MSTPTRPLTKAERRKYNQSLHEQQIKRELIAKHGPELGQFLAWLRIMTIRGTQAHRAGDPTLARETVLALENVHRRHCQ